MDLEASKSKVLRENRRGCVMDLEAFKSQVQ